MTASTLGVHHLWLTALDIEAMRTHFAEAIEFALQAFDQSGTRPVTCTIVGGPVLELIAPE